MWANFSKTKFLHAGGKAYHSPTSSWPAAGYSTTLNSRYNHTLHGLPIQKGTFKAQIQPFALPFFCLVTYICLHRIALAGILIDKNSLWGCGVTSLVWLAPLLESSTSSRTISRFNHRKSSFQGKNVKLRTICISRRHKRPSGGSRRSYRDSHPFLVSFVHFRHVYNFHSV